MFAARNILLTSPAFVDLYFFDASAASSVTVANPGGSPLLVSSWASTAGASDIGRTLSQGVSLNQPRYTGSNRVTFADTSDVLAFNSPVAQAGWQVVGTSRGTFAYRVNAASQSSIRLFGNQGAIHTTGDLYGVIYLPATAGASMIAKARKKLTDRGAASEVVGTNVASWWQGRGDIVEFGLRDFSAVTNFVSAWQNCSSLTSFPLINTGNSTSFTNTWSNCSSLASFPLIDASKVTLFNNTWQHCSSLTSFPLINTSSGTNFSGAWQNCSSLTSFPLINTGNGTNFASAWPGCTSLTSFPLLDTAKGTSFNGAWHSCAGLTSFPLITTSLGTNFTGAWQNCSGLTSFPLIDTANGTNFVSTWSGCSGLTSFPLINTSKGTSFNGAWRNCNSLPSFPSGFFDNWIATPVSNCFLNTWTDCLSLTATSVENIFTSIAASGRSAPATGTEITVVYKTSTGTPNITAAVSTLKSRGWTPRLNGTLL